MYMQPALLIALLLEGRAQSVVLSAAKMGNAGGIGLSLIPAKMPMPPD
jgi:hypothetical protein